MHRIWEILDVVAHIVSYLKEYEDQSAEDQTQKVSSASLASLAALARTCHTISPAALDVLWADPGDIGNVLTCLPRSTWRVQHDSKPLEVELVGSRKLPSPAEWERLRESPNARRVRHISIGVCACQRRSSSVCPCFFTLKQLNKNLLHWSCNREYPLFPQLRTLRYTIESDLRHPDIEFSKLFPEFLFYLGGRQLTRFEISGPLLNHYVNLLGAPAIPTERPRQYTVASRPREVEGFVSVPRAFKLLQEKYPKLARLSLGSMGESRSFHRDGFAEVPAAPDTLFSRLTDLHSLKTLLLCFPTTWQSTGRRLASCNLRDLYIQIPVRTLDTRGAALPLVRFPVLVSLTVSGAEQICSKFLQTIDVPLVKSVSIEVTQTTFGDATNTKRLMEVLASRCPKVLALFFSFSTRSYGRSIASDTLEPLLAITGLMSFSLIHYKGRGFNDLSLTAMARAWPKLLHLNMHQWHMDQWFPLDTEGDATTASSLLSLVDHCKHIQNVRIPLVGIVVPDGGMLADARILQLTSPTCPGGPPRRLVVDPTSVPFENQKRFLELFRDLSFEFVTTRSLRTAWKQIEPEVADRRGHLPVTFDKFVKEVQVFEDLDATDAARRLYLLE